MVDFPKKEKYDVSDFRMLVKVLRGEGGCPWDREQTHGSLRRCLLEETDELCEAIDTGSLPLMREELGDVLLQVLFHADIEEDAGHFDIDDVADAEIRKLISRHPHVFGEVQVSSSGQVLQNWEKIKQEEKAERTPAEAMDRVCRTLPGLWRAEKIQKKSQKDIPAEEAFSAINESAAALQAAASPEEAKAALGTLLFHAVAAARLREIDPEEALHAHCEEYIRRFR